VGSTMPYQPEEDESPINSEPQDDQDDDDDDDFPEVLYQERIYFRLYDPQRYDLFFTGTSLYFDGEAHGSLSNLIQIDFK